MKKPLRKSFSSVAVLVATTIAIAGCGGAPPLHKPKPLSSAPNSGYRIQMLWSVDIGGGPGQTVSGLRMAVDGNEVFTAGTGGLVSVHSVDTGETIWTTDLDVSLTAGPAVGSGVVVVATRDGELRALSAETGERMWKQQLASAIIASPSIAHDTVVVHMLDGSTVALEAKSGVREWTVQSAKPRLTMRGTSRPVIAGRTVYVGMDSGKVQALKLSDGSVIWTQTAALPAGRTELERIVDVDANVLVKPSVVYAVSVGNRLAAMTRAGGDILWRQEVSSSKGLAADREQLYTVNTASVVLALSRRNGHMVWKNDAFKYRRLSAPAVYRGGVLVGDYQGYLHWLGSDNGDGIARGHPLDAAILTAPQVVDGKVLVLGADGTLAAVMFVGAG